MSVVSFVVRWVLLAAAVVLAAWVTPDAEFRGGPFSALLVATLIAAANVVAQLTLRWFPTPDDVVPLAALTMVVNGCVVWLASVFTTRLRIEGFVAAVTFALMVTVFSIALSWSVEKLRDRRRGRLAGDQSSRSA